MTFKQRLLSLLAIIVGAASLAACVPATDTTPEPNSVCRTGRIVDLTIETVDSDGTPIAGLLPLDVEIGATSTAEGHPGIVLGENATGTADAPIPIGTTPAELSVTFSRTTPWHATICHPTDLPVHVVVIGTVGDSTGMPAGSGIHCVMVGPDARVVAEDTVTLAPRATSAGCSYDFTPSA